MPEVQSKMTLDSLVIMNTITSSIKPVMMILQVTVSILFPAQIMKYPTKMCLQPFGEATANRGTSN